MSDDLRQHPPGPIAPADICIVGAGAAGITLALEMRGSGKSVLLLEAGGEAEEPATQALYAGETADEALHPPPDKYRVRRFGGSTTIWGGRCMPFDAIDFEARDWIPHSGWPIRLDDLAPYYPRASELVDAGRHAYTAEAAYDGPSPPLIRGFDSEAVPQDRLERFSLPTDFGRRYREALQAAPGLRVLLHANVTAIRLTADGLAVDHLDVATLDGARHTVRAAEFVLATGGLEVPRLLLASNDVAPAGIGNGHGLVGRYYMCHIAGTAGVLTVTRPRADVHHGYVMTPDGVYARRRFAIAEAVQRTRRIGNFVARLHFANLNDPAHRSGILSGLYLAKSFISYEYSKRLHDGRRRTLGSALRHLRNVLFDPFDTLAFLWHWLTRRTLATRKFPSVVIPSRANRFSLDFHAEQVPNPDSRVHLIDARDALGMPRLRIDWRYRQADIDTVRGGLAVIRDELARTGCGELVYDESSVAEEALRYGAYGGHHLGTARMGASPETGVVDADLRVFGVRNLSIASGAVFPTSSQANPTLTIVALAVRLARRLAAAQ